jgi:signal transduction histidine kinase
MKVRQVNAKRGKMSHCALVAATILLLAGRTIDSPAHAAGPRPSRLVVVLYPEAADGSPGNAQADHGIRSTFRESKGLLIEIHNEYLDVSRFPDALYQQELLKLLHLKYSGRRVDLVITGLASALDFAIEHHDALFPDAPKIYFSVDEKEVKERTMAPDMIGVPIKMDLKESLNLALALHPKTRHVFVVAGKAKFDIYWETVARNTFREFEKTVSVDYLCGLPMPELLDRVANLPDPSLIYYLHVFEDGDGMVHMPAEVLTQISAVSSAPIYSHVDSYVGRGIVGGKVFSFEQEGKRAAELGLRLLSGETPQSVGIQKTSDNAYAFDARQLKQWHIDEWQLPAGSSVRFLEPDFWRQYRWQIIVAAAVCAVQGILIVVLIVQRRRRSRFESSSRQELQELGGRLFVAQEIERKRIARELHDDFGQTLALLSVEMDLMDQSSDKTNENLGPRIEAMSARVKQLSTSIHELSHQLHPIKLEQLGLATALSSHCKELSRTHGLAITFSHDGLSAVSPETSLCIYRVAQEALSNAIRHSSAKAVSIGLAAVENVISLEVSDDGCGFDLAAVGKREGLGLVSIRERLRTVNGSLIVDAKPSQGTRLKIDIPITNEAKKL